VGLVLGAAEARAEDDVARPSGRRVQQDDWTFVAVLSMQGESASVPGVLALRDKANATGDNIVAIWYENPGQSSGDWSAKAWQSQNQAEAVKYVKGHYLIDDRWDMLWPTGDQLENPYAADPLDYDRGLLVSDVYSFLVDSASRDVAVRFLTDIGYTSAYVPFESSSEVTCGKNDFLSAYADAVVFGATHESASDSDWLERSSTQLLLACAAPPAAPVLPTILPGTAIPVPGTAINPDWWFDPSTTIRDPTCDTTSSCCYRTKIKFLYSAGCLFGTCIYYCQADYSWNCPVVPPAPCPATPACADPIGPLFPPSGYTADCGHSYY
jgi:hypothetical protein